MIYYTRPQRIALNHCPEQGIYLRWLSPLGSWDGWLFSGDIDTSVSLENATSYRPGAGRYTVARQRPGVDGQLLRTGNLKAAEHQALTTLLDSPQVYEQFADGRREPRYVLPNNSATRTSADGLYEFDVQLEVRRRNSITN